MIPPRARWRPGRKGGPSSVVRLPSAVLCPPCHAPAPRTPHTTYCPICYVMHPKTKLHFRTHCRRASCVCLRVGLILLCGDTRCAAACMVAQVAVEPCVCDACVDSQSLETLESRRVEIARLGGGYCRSASASLFLHRSIRFQLPARDSRETAGSAVQR